MVPTHSPSTGVILPMELEEAGGSPAAGPSRSFYNKTSSLVADISPKRLYCSCCCGLGCYCALVPFFIIISSFVLFGGTEWKGAGPGDLIRRELQNGIVSALSSGKWSQVDKDFASLDVAENSALLIGDSRGKQWESERGWVTLDESYAIASESKMIASLTVWRVMRHTSLTLDSTPSDYFESWSGEPAVTLEQLLAFTSGLRGSDEGSCAFNGGDTSWGKCVDELAGLQREVAGETYNYNSKHLVVACAMAQRALDRPLTTSAWEQTVAEELFSPAGIGGGSGAVDYGGINSDIPESMPIYGSWYWDTSEAFPGFAHAMRMTGRQYAKVLQALMFEGLLDGDDGARSSLAAMYGGSVFRDSTVSTGLEAFAADRTLDVVKWQSGDVGGYAGLDIGTWHYAQGAWIACDAASEEANEDGKLGNSDGAKANEVCGVAPEPRVLHSFGFWGAYFWIDLTNMYYGVLVHSWAIDMRNMYWIGVCLSCFTSALVVGLWYRFITPTKCCSCCS